MEHHIWVFMFSDMKYSHNRMLIQEIFEKAILIKSPGKSIKSTYIYLSIKNCSGLTYYIHVYLVSLTMLGDSFGRYCRIVWAW